MYSRELEELIESVLADGVLTDKERTVLRKRAQACGEDPDEVMVVVEGRLTKMNKQPTNEKRGNVVKCPNCGATVDGGAVKCSECGYVFTNMKTNSSSERFAKELAALLDKHKNADLLDERINRDREIKEFIMSFPIPSGKEDMLEFISGMDARRRVHSKYQSAYNAKFKECVTKARVQFAEDAQISSLLSQTGKFSAFKFAVSSRIFLVLLLVFVVIAAVAGHSYYENNKFETLIKPQIDKQYDEICNIVDGLPAPTKTNYDECALAIKRISWKLITNSRKNFDAYRYEEDVMDKASAKVNGYIDMLHTINMEYFDPWGNPTDKSSNNWYDKTGVNEIIQHTKNAKYIDHVNFRYSH